MFTSELIKTIFLSVKIALLATAINLPLALAGAYLLEKVVKRGKILLEGCINLPLVMPPVTTGYVLLLILGKRGIVGSLFFRTFGFSIAYTGIAAVLASMIVSYPLVIRSIRGSMEMIDPRLGKAATTLGAGSLSVFFRVTLPLILPGMINGIVLGFARSLGEFGATITFAGNIQNETRTIPLAVYTSLQIPGKEKDAGVLVLISIVISFMAMFFSSYLNQTLIKGRKNHGS
jgi:molybdate transport system permease protein